MPPSSPNEFPFPLLFSNSETMRRYDNQRCNKVPFRSPAVFPANLNFSQRTIHVFGSSEEETEDEYSNENRGKVVRGLSESPARQKKLNLTGFSFAKTKPLHPEDKQLMSPLLEEGACSSTRLMPCPQIELVLTTSPIFKDQPTLSSSEVLPKPSSGWPKTKNPSDHYRVDKSQIFSTHAHTRYPNTLHGKLANSAGSPGVFTPPSQWGPRPKTPKISLVSPNYVPSPFNTQQCVPASSSSRGPSAEMLASIQFLSELCRTSPESSDEDSLLSNSTADEPVTP